jgi:ABC-type branched-subunit amino acid transport system ATPase component
MGRHVDPDKKRDARTNYRSYGQRATLRRMQKNPAGTSSLMRAIMSTSATASGNVVIDLRN